MVINRKYCILIAGLMTLLTTGCAQKEDINIENKVQSIPSSNLSNDERKVFYKGDYEVQYKEPRVVWFKPMLTNKGNVLSERTITLAPKELKWSQNEGTNVGEKFKELAGE